MPTSTLIATLGSQPQVIPLAVQLLEQQGDDVSKVIVLHTDPTIHPIDAALSQLKIAFLTYPAWPRLETELIPTRDIVSPEEIDLFAELLFTVTKREISIKQRIHLLLAGGRKPMAMIGMSIAQLLLGNDDCVWYLHSDDMLRQSESMVLPVDGSARLVSIPLPQHAGASPRYTRIFEAETLDEARQVTSRARTERLRHFVDVELTSAERKVAALIATELLTTDQIAERLGKRPKTVTNQLSSIFSKLEVAFSLQPDQRFKREFLRQELRVYFMNAENYL